MIANEIKLNKKMLYLLMICYEREEDHTHTHIQKEKEEVDEGCKEGMIFLSKY